MFIDRKEENTVWCKNMHSLHQVSRGVLVQQNKKMIGMIRKKIKFYLEEDLESLVYKKGSKLEQSCWPMPCLCTLLD